MHRTTERFWKCFDRLPTPLQSTAKNNFELLKTDPSHPSLHVKKVGTFWSARVGISHRALAVEDGNDFIWVWIGTHDEYERIRFKSQAISPAAHDWRWATTENRFDRMKKTAYLDKDEKELAESLEKDNWISDLDKKEKKQYEAYARYSLNKQKRINIRMSERDLKKIRAKAIEEGIPYQSLTSMLIHKYNEGKLSISMNRPTKKSVSNIRRSEFES